MMTTPPLPQWQTASTNAAFSEPFECSVRASKFERTIWRRNVIEYAAAVFISIVMGASAVGAFVKGETAVGAALALTVVGVGVAMWGLHKRGSNLARLPEDPCLVHLRRQYERQYEALRAVPLWYIGPLIPGVALLYIAVTARVAEKTGWMQALEGIAGSAAITFGIFALVAVANWFGARSLKRKIAEIDALA